MENFNTQSILLKYGSSTVPVELRQDAVPLLHTEPSKETDSRKFREELHSRLLKMDQSVQNVGIVVCDKTRLCEYPGFLPVITDLLQELGTNKENITFYIAYGTHPRQTEEESISSYGETYHNFKFVHHNSRDEDQLVTLGSTSRGTDVKICKALLDHDLIITFGAILHHYFAGFGGGRKMLFPGLAGYDSILKNHSLFLDYEKSKVKTGCTSGNLDTNPLALDLEEINHMLPDRLEIYGILNSRKEVCELYLGNSYSDYTEACQRYDHFFRSDDERLFDLVVASAGGYPKDINFIQAHKSIHNAASFVNDQGALVIFAECRDGIGNRDFMELFELGRREQLYKRMSIQYANNAGTAAAMMDKARRIRIHFVTSLDQSVCEQMGAIGSSPEEAIEIIRNETGKVAWIENASLIYKQEESLKG